MQATHINSAAEIDMITLPVDMTANVYVQLWGEDNKIKSASPGFANITSSLDQLG